MESLFTIHKNRLALFKKWENDAEDWEKIWLAQSIPLQFINAKMGKLGEFEIFTKYLPKDAPILEAGCGTGWIVAALSARGFSVEGVDYAQKTIGQINRYAPELKVRVGNIYHLDVPSKTYGGYISLGVFEHNQEGPSKGLAEARRVLKDDGVALISVPLLNRERYKLFTKYRNNNSNSMNKELNFYQYYFSQDEFTFLLKNAGFSVIEVFPYAVFAGITRDFPVGRWLFQHKFFHWRLQRAFSSLCRTLPQKAKSRWAHMMLYICKPY